MIYEDEHGRDLRGLMEIIVAKNGQRPLGSVLLNYRQETGLVTMKVNTDASMPVRLKDLSRSNKAVKRLIKTFDLEEELPY